MVTVPDLDTRTMDWGFTPIPSGIRFEVRGRRLHMIYFTIGSLASGTIGSMLLAGLGTAALWGHLVLTWALGRSR
jgi:hypothetical protein